MSRDTRVGYVIVDWATPYLAARARNSIQEHRPDSRVVVVDARAEALGYAAALNKGIASLLGLDGPEIVVALNADVEMLEGDDPILWRFRFGSSIAIIGPRQVDAEDRIVHGGIVPSLDGGSPWDVDLHHRYWKHSLDEERAASGTRIEMDVPMVPGSVLYVRRSALEELGGFPEFTRFYYEDTALCFLARHRDWRVLYTGATTWRHYHEGSPLSRDERVDRMTVAREAFVYWCGQQRIPLRLGHEVPL